MKRRWWIVGVVLAAILQAGVLQTAGVSAEPEAYYQSEWIEVGAVPERTTVSLELSSGVTEGLAATIGVIVIIGYLLLSYYTDETEGAERREPWAVFRRPKKKQNDIYEYQQLQRTDLSRLMIKDPRFSADRFASETRELFLSVIGALKNKDIKELRYHVTGKMYDALSKKLLEYQNLNRKEVWERVMVNNAVITNYQERKNSDLLEVTVHVTMNHYVEDKKTGAILEGDLLGLYKYQYQMEYIRRVSGEETYRKSSEGVQDTCCPHCGAPLKVRNQTKCPYCKSIIMTETKEGQRTENSSRWLLNQMNGGLL